MYIINTAVKSYTCYWALPREKNNYAAAIVADYIQTSEEATLDSPSTRCRMRPIQGIELGFNTSSTHCSSSLTATALTACVQNWTSSNRNICLGKAWTFRVFLDFGRINLLATSPCKSWSSYTTHTSPIRSKFGIFRIILLNYLSHDIICMLI